MEVVGLLSMFIAAGALLVAVKSYTVAQESVKAADRAARAAIYEKRYEIYEEAEEFISAWIREGNPPIHNLGQLVGAWSRSHFLCRPEATTYLRKIWTDAIEAAEAVDIINGDAEGDHLEAVYNKHERLRQTADYDKLRAVFMDDLKV